MNWDTDELTEQLAFEVSTDGAYLRDDKERLYFSGIEIASMLALGVLASFLGGVIKGANKAIAKKGEQLGALAVDTLAEKIKVLSKRLVSARGMGKQEAKAVVEDAKVQLDTIAADPIVSVALTRQIEAPDEEVTLSVTQYLRAVGYSERDAESRAAVLIERITVVAKR